MSTLIFIFTVGYVAGSMAMLPRFSVASNAAYTKGGFIGGERSFFSLTGEGVPIIDPGTGKAYRAADDLAAVMKHAARVVDSECDEELEVHFAEHTALCARHKDPTYVQPLVPALFNFLVVGDWGRDGLCCQRDVAVEMAKAAAHTEASFVVSTGDNFYPRGIASRDAPNVRTSWDSVYRSYPPLDVRGPSRACGLGSPA